MTAKSLAHYRGIAAADIAPRDIKTLTRDEAAALFTQNYIGKPLWGRLQDDWTFLYAVDCTVHHGPSRAARILQEAASPALKVDGIFGPESTRVVNQISTGLETKLDWATRVRHARMSFFVGIVLADQSQLAFLKGWTNRTFAL